MATARQWQSRAAGTWLNHKAAVKTYLAFSNHLGLDPAHLHHAVLCVFIEYLNLHVAAPSSISNQVSAVRVFMALAGYPTQEAYHPRVVRSLEALHRNKGYVPNVKDPVPMGILRQVVLGLNKSPEHRLAKAALLIQFYGALRKSEVCPPTIKRFKSTCHLTREDVSLEGGKLTLVIKAAKNMQRTDQRRKIVLESAQDKDLCVVEAAKAAMAVSPTIKTTDPFLMFPSREPVPFTHVEKVWAAALRDMGIKDRKFTLHCLRSAAATEAFEEGVPELDIQKYGGWRSTVHRQYIRRSNNVKVNKSLIRSLKHKT